MTLRWIPSQLNAAAPPPEPAKIEEKKQAAPSPLSAGRATAPPHRSLAPLLLAKALLQGVQQQRTRLRQ